MQGDPTIRTDEELWNTVRSGEVSHADVIHRRENGTFYREEMRIAPVLDSTGKLVSYLAIKQDAAERTEDSQPFLAAIVEASEDAIVSTTPAGVILTWNRGAEVIFGYSAQEAIGKPVSMLMPPPNLADLSYFIGEVLHGKTVSQYEGFCLHKDGGKVLVSVTGSPVTNAFGEVVALSAILRDVTERRLIEGAFRQSAEQFRALFERSDDYLYIHDLSGNFLDLNPAALRALGYARSDIPSLNLSSLLGQDQLSFALRRLKQFETNGFRSENPEFRLKCKNGAFVDVETTITMIPYASNPHAVLGIARDITERKRIERSLRFQHSLIRAIHQVSLDGILVVNDENLIVSHNQKLLDVWRIPWPDVPDDAPLADYAIGDQPPPILSAALDRVKDPEAFLKRVRELYADPNAKDHSEIELKDGRTLERYSAGMRSETGESLGRVWFFRDITTRKQSEQALQRSEEQFRQLAENIHEVFWIVPAGAVNEISYVSPAFEQVFGHSCASVYKNPSLWTNAIHPMDKEQARLLFARQIQGEALDSEYRIHTPDGTEKWIRDSAFPVRDAAGQLIRIVGIAEDISERRRYQEKLIQAQQGAEAANRAKSCFLANMSHEIRTPMNGVLGMLQLLAATNLSPQQQRYATVAETSGWALLRLIDDILDLSKIEAGKIALENLGFDLRETVEKVVQLMQVKAASKGLAITWQLSSDIPSLLSGDSHRLGQVLTNLIGNAVKFTKQGGIQLDATLDSLCDSTATIRFAVHDTGIGIRPDQVAALFSPFTQVDSSTTRKYGGTGLGLTISKHLVELMGGSIGVDSQEGQGSTFWFTVVFELVPPDRQPPANDKPSLRQGVPGEVISLQHAARILIAEDTLTNREVATAQLTKLGYRASAVTNGAEAVEALQHGNFDLVLMDCQMPVMDGFEATRRIRASVNPGIPIVAMTADAMSDDRDRCMREGMSDYIAKPVELGRLREILAQWLPVPVAGG